MDVHIFTKLLLYSGIILEHASKQQLQNLITYRKQSVQVGDS